MQSHTAHGELFGGHPVILTTRWALRLSLDWHGHCNKGNLEGLGRQKLILWILLIQILEKASREHGGSVCVVFYSAVWHRMTVGIVRGETTGTCDVTAACPGCLGLASDKIWTVDWFTASFTLHPSLCDSTVRMSTANWLSGVGYILDPD